MSEILSGEIPCLNCKTPKVLKVRNGDEAWNTRIVPTARACERFFSNLLWFLLLACVLFSYNPFR